MKTSKQVAGELTDDQSAKVLSDEDILKNLEALSKGGELTAATQGVVDDALSLLKTYNDALLEQEKRRGEAIRGFHGSNDEIAELEAIIGGDRDLSTGFACLRTEEGDAPNEVLVFLKGEFLGQVRVHPDGATALVKRHGNISQKKYDKKGKAIVSVLMQTADLIAMELVKSRDKESDDDFMKRLESDSH